jgi:uncharacterized GH25 family protein
MSRRLLPCLICAVLASASVSAHDFWLAAVHWTPALGEPITITAGLGERFPARTDFQVRGPWLSEWRVIGPRGDIPVTNDFRQDGLVMAMDVGLPAPGAYLAIATVAPLTIHMDAQEFTDYLQEEGLHAIITARERLGETGTSAKERYTRYAKVAFRNGNANGLHLTRPINVEAEFVPFSDPTSVRVGDTLTLQLLLDGTALPHVTVSAVTEGSATTTQTDENGAVTFRIDRAGAWMVKAIHMVRLPQPDFAEWESFWVTLAFHTSS